MTVGSARRWGAGEVVTAALRIEFINDVIDDLAGRDDTVQLENSLEIGDGADGDRYLLLPASTASAGGAGRLRYNGGAVQLHNGTGWLDVYDEDGANVDLFQALDDASDVGTGSEQVARGNHTH